jgi:hypothetical protein
VGPLIVALDPPVLQDDLSFEQGAELAGVEQLVA